MLGWSQKMWLGWLTKKLNRFLPTQMDIAQIKKEISPTLKLAIPIMLGMLGYGLMFIIDVTMAGHLGETALAASALASNLNYIPYVFGIGLVGAISVYQSQDNGAGVEESAPAILRHGYDFSLCIQYSSCSDYARIRLFFKSFRIGSRSSTRSSTFFHHYGLGDGARFIISCIALSS
jgi:hypothetical protein